MLCPTACPIKKKKSGEVLTFLLGPVFALTLSFQVTLFPLLLVLSLNDSFLIPREVFEFLPLPYCVFFPFTFWSVPPHYPVVCCPTSGPQMCSKRPARGRATLGSQRKRRKSVTPDPKEKQTCGEEVQGFQRWSRLEAEYKELLGH